MSNFSFYYLSGYTIPKGWTILVVPAAVQLNPNTYKDPLVFDPSRWEVSENIYIWFILFYLIFYLIIFFDESRIWVLFQWQRTS